MHRHPHILSAASNLLAICFVIIGGLKLTNSNGSSLADEFAWLAASLLFVSVITSYLAIRNNDAVNWQNALADYAFLGGLLALMGSVLLAAVSL